MNPTPPKKHIPTVIEEITIVPAKTHKSEISFKQGATKQEDDVLKITISKSKKDNKNKRPQPETSTGPSETQQ